MSFFARNSCSDDDGWDLQDEESDLCFAELKSQIQGGLQAQLFRSSDPVEEPDSGFWASIQKRATASAAPAAQPQDLEIPPPPPPPPCPTSTSCSVSPFSSSNFANSSTFSPSLSSSSAVSTTPTTSANPSYCFSSPFSPSSPYSSTSSFSTQPGVVPPGLYLYANPHPAPPPAAAHGAPYGYQPYLPEEIYGRPQPAPVFPASPASALFAPPRMSEIPNPFSSAHGIVMKPMSLPPPPAPVAASTGPNLRKIAAASRPRNKDGTFVSKKQVALKEQDTVIKVVDENPSPAAPSPPVDASSPSLPLSPEFLEAHVATLQKQLAQATEESERLRMLLNQTQTELAELKLSTQDHNKPNIHNKRLRPTRPLEPTLNDSRPFLLLP